MSGFLDTNILVYALGNDDRRRPVAQALMTGGNAISVQVLNEFVSVIGRKFRRSPLEIDDALALIRQMCRPIISVDLTLHDRAMVLYRVHRFNLYDALIVAAALTAGCDTLYSEDMHAGLVVDGRLTIVDPFA